MTQLISLGAINKLTGKYVYPKIANKKDEYICTECNKDLILCKGDIRVPHFRHKVDTINPCHYYNKPNESQIHKDAKFLLKNLLENKIPISFFRNCVSCKKIEELKIPEITENYVIELEYRFDYRYELKIADVAIINNDIPICIFEIYNTHKTNCDNRPEPWFEIDAKTLLNIANDINFNSFNIPCIRCEECIDCDIEKYVRCKLGQKYPFPDYDDTWRPDHLRFDFDARSDSSDINHNKDIINLFKNDFGGKNVIFHSREGCSWVYILSDINYNDKYWDYYSNNIPCEKLLEYMSGYVETGTVNIIINLINECKKIVNKDKNTRYIKRNIDTDGFVYLNVDFSKKDLIKKLGGMWNKEHKLWYISDDKYYKKQNYIDEFIGDKIIWICKECEDMKKLKKNGDSDNENTIDICKNCLIKNRADCICGGSGKSYWSDGIYGSCLECCCINCDKFNNECKCKYCNKCENSYMKDEEHKCYLCEKCGRYVIYEKYLQNHCQQCSVCNKFTNSLRTNGKCGPCYDGSKL